MGDADGDGGRVLGATPGDPGESALDPLGWSRRDVDPAERQRRRAVARYQRQQRSLRARNIKDDRLAQVLDEALSAETPTYATHKGSITDVRRDPDHATRLKALDRAARAIGWEDLSIETSPAAQGPVNIQIVLESSRGTGTGYGAVDPPDAPRLGISICQDGGLGGNGHGRGGP